MVPVHKRAAEILYFRLAETHGIKTAPIGVTVPLAGQFRFLTFPVTERSPFEAQTRAIPNAAASLTIDNPCYKVSFCLSGGSTPDRSL